MRIAQIAPLYETVPPTAYGGTERVIATLCDGLVELGHDVTLFAAEPSRTAARLEPVLSAPVRTRMTREEMIESAPGLHERMLADVFELADDFDVIHSHVDLQTLPFAEQSRVPTILTMHGRLDLPVVRSVLPRYPGVPLVSISDDQRRALGDHDLNWVRTVYNGLDLPRYAAEPRRPDGSLAFMGRISPEKGPAQAVEIARRSGRRLRVAAKVDPLDYDYFAEEIEPLFTPELVDFLGEVDEEHKPSFFARAAATLFPSDWPEPFGLVMIESMAAGTPVIALRRGAVPEVLVDGVTGFVCDDLEDMVRAVERIGEIDPEDCRRRARRFDGATMCAEYVKVYEAVTRGVDQLDSSAVG